MSRSIPSEQELVSGRYVVEHVIGTGGMGRVHHGYHVDLKQEVAIKYLQASPRARRENADRRFYHEALTYASINHPNVVKLLDFDSSARGELCMVLEFVKGETLRMFMKRTGQCHPVFALETAKQIAQGLSAAHAKSIIHRDLKPDNVMLSPLTRHRHSYHVKLLDFGIAKHLDYIGERYTVDGAVCGTPNYMSPEQAMGHDIDERSDLYSLGVLIFEMLANRLPYVVEGKQEVMRAHCCTPIPLVSDHSRYSIPTILEDLLQRCLAKNPCDRFQTAEDLIDAIEQVLTHEYDIVTAVKYNALTPTGDAIRFQQHVGRLKDQADYLSSEHSIAGVDPIRSTYPHQKPAVLSGAHGDRSSGLSMREAASRIGSLQHISEILKDHSAVGHAQSDELSLIDEPPESQVHGSLNDYHHDGLRLKKYGVWFREMWDDLQKSIEEGNARSLMGGIGVTLALILFVSVGLRPHQEVTTYPAAPEATQEQLLTSGPDQNLRLDRSRSPYQLDEESKLRSDTIVMKRREERSRQNFEVAPTQTERTHDSRHTPNLESELPALIEVAEQKYRDNQLDEALRLIAPLIGDRDASLLRNKIKMLKNFQIRVGDDCVSFDRERESVHPNISQHAYFKRRERECHRNLPPDDL